MKIAVVITIRSWADVELARRPIAGQPWLARLVQRLRHATSVSRIVVACRTHADDIASLVDTSETMVVPATEPLDTACRLSEDHDGVALCRIEQLLVDPVRLDALASRDHDANTGRIHAVLASDPLISLTGGVFLEVFTRQGLRDVTREEELPHLQPATWPTWPEAPEMRIEEHGDVDFAAAAYEAMLARDPSGGVSGFEEVLSDPSLRAIAFWDELRRFVLSEDLGSQAPSILTIRCLPRPLFDNTLRYLGRLRPRGVDVVCQARTGSETSEHADVDRIYPFAPDTFSVEELEHDVIDSIREREYDLCVVPVREPTAWGLDNIVPLGVASRARSVAWLDIFGRCGPLPCASRGSATTTGRLTPPQTRADAYLRRAVKALDAFATTEAPVRASSERLA